LIHLQRISILPAEPGISLSEKPPVVTALCPIIIKSCIFPSIFIYLKEQTFSTIEKLHHNLTTRAHREHRK
jgi:hypothetical protein